jgi:hypothetical protein
MNPATRASYASPMGSSRSCLSLRRVAATFSPVASWFRGGAPEKVLYDQVHCHSQPTLRQGAQRKA